MAEIEEFYVITENGACVFAKTGGRDGMQSDLLAGFLSAINMLSTHVTSDTIKAFNFGNRQLILHQDHGMQFVAVTGKGVHPNGIRKQLQAFAARFFELYSPEYMTKKWSGNLDIFTRLNEPFNQFIADPLVRMQAVIW